ncbi:MAG: hypothetical protein IKM24_03250, partial [Clostridia bacterium]|nr:hypothetical protein [Clostridia bacterium]
MSDAVADYKKLYNRSIATLHICLGKYISAYIADISYPQRGYIIRKMRRLLMKFLDIGTKSTVYGDGVHDDTKALQECLDQMKDGGTLFFPDGTYLLSGALIFYS